MAKTLDEAGVKRLIQEIKGANKNLNAPIPISTENTTESMAQNVKNIADYVEKAKAAGIANVDGMGVTCLINGGISGLGYIYVAGNSFELIGMTMEDDMVDNAFFIVREGEFNSRKIAFEGTVDTVTSDMLVEGARRPIILTPSTTEVDEETYQKLLNDDVDVVYNTINMTTKDIDSDKNITMTFSYAICAADIMQIASIDIQISSTSPHSVVKGDPVEQNISPKQVVNKSILSPVLQEINLTGTDADRKAKLDQFETDWKALTGASDLTGARFVGKFGITDDVERNITGIMTYCAGDTATDANDNCFYGICNGYSFSEQKSQIAVKVSCTDGSLTITPLFSHLEAITIKTGNTPDDKAANVAAIEAYEANLQALGVDVTKGYMIPVCFSDTELGYVMYHPFSTGSKYTGIVTGPGGASSNIAIEKNGYAYVTTHIQPVESSSLTTTAKAIVPAINEVNANAVHSDKLVPTLEAITIKTDNTPESKAANVAAIKAYVDNLKALGVDVTKGYMIPITASGRNGFLSTRSGNYPYAGYAAADSTINDFYNILILGNGEYYDSKIQQEVSSELHTISKQIVGAINEVNTLVEEKADKTLNAKSLEAITIKTDNTPESKAANVAAIKAYVDNLEALGVDVTKGYMIPFGRYNSIAYGILVGSGENPRLQGYMNSDYTTEAIFISPDGTVNEISLQSRLDAGLKTNSKIIAKAINEVNALAKGYSTPIELTTDPAQNKTAIDARVAEFTAQGISLTNGCCIPVTYKGVYAGNISLINGDWYGLLVKNTNNPADNINIKLSADGTIIEGNSAQ